MEKLDERRKGSLTEEQLLQMVRDFIESEAESSESLSTSNPLSQDYKSRCLTLQEILWEVTDIEVDILQKTLKYVESVEFAKGTTNFKRLLVMKLKMDGYDASLCKTSWVFSADRLKVFHCGGDYEYIDVMTREKNGEKTTRVIVDMDFRSQFELAKTTTGYTELTDMVPCVFVGSEAKLSKIVSILCSAAKEALKEKGLHVPPWRKATYMQSKWLSKDCKKISIASMKSPLP